MGSNSPQYQPTGSSSVFTRSGEGDAPEVVPPEAIAPPDAPRRRKPVWLAAPATHLLVAINCAVFLAMVAKGVSPISPTVDQLVNWGANGAGEVLLHGQWWRIVTAMFIHVGILHLATNMWCLWNLGLLAEPLMGSWGVLAVYILTGAAGNLLSTCVNWLEYSSVNVFPAGAGASGAVFGIAGALIVLLKSNRLPVPPVELKKLRRSVIYFAAINLFIGISISIGTAVMGAGLSIDNYAHMGGCACGLLFAWPMVPRLGSPRPSFNLRLRIAVGMIVGILVLFGFYVAHIPQN
ncbi:MAG: rhomboid family intramembrane serine protease [Terracidiphilus sp.]